MQIEKLTGGLPLESQKKIEDFFVGLDGTLDLPLYSKMLLIEHFVTGFEYYLDKNYEIDDIIKILNFENLGGFYKRDTRQYYALDNAALVYPMGMKYGQMPLFRLSMELKEEIVPCLLQLALDFTIKRFPVFSAVIKNGFFWHYLETTNNIHLVEEEKDIPCKPISLTVRTQRSLRVFYYKKRISVEFFHVLTDGNGGLIFLKTLVAEYLKLKGLSVTKEKGVFDIDETPDKREFVNEFALAKGESDFSTFVDKKSLQLDGKNTNLNINRIIHYVIDTEELRKVSKKYNTTITGYFTAIEFLAAKKCISKDNGIFNIQIPVNMRKFNNSITLRNYSMYFNASMDLKDINDKQALIDNVTKQIKKYGGFENMNHMMLTTVKAIKIISHIPLFIKVPITQLVYGYLANSIIGSTLSNLGNVELPEEMKSEVEKMYFLLCPGIPNRVSSTLVSINNKTVFSLIKNSDNFTFEEEVLNLLKEDGLKIELEGSSIYES